MVRDFYYIIKVIESCKPMHCSSAPIRAKQWGLKVLLAKEKMLCKKYPKYTIEFNKLFFTYHEYIYSTCESVIQFMLKRDIKNEGE